MITRYDPQIDDATFAPILMGSGCNGKTYER